MKLFQVLWGYITIAAVTRFFIEIVSLLLPVNHKTIFSRAPHTELSIYSCSSSEGFKLSSWLSYGIKEPGSSLEN